MIDVIKDFRIWFRFHGDIRMCKFKITPRSVKSTWGLLLYENYKNQVFKADYVRVSISVFDSAKSKPYSKILVNQVPRCVSFVITNCG